MGICVGKCFRWRSHCCLKSPLIFSRKRYFSPFLKSTELLQTNISDPWSIPLRFCSIVSLIFQFVDYWCLVFRSKLVFVLSGGVFISPNVYHCTLLTPKMCSLYHSAWTVNCFSFLSWQECGRAFQNPIIVSLLKIAAILQLVLFL